MTTLFVWLALITSQTLTVNHRTYTVRIVPTASKPLQVFQGGRLIASALSKAYHPWALQIADVDGDDKQEITVGLTKRTHNLKFLHRTIFVLNFDGREITKKWAGSTMGRPLLEFCYGVKRPHHPQTLYTLERRLDDRVALSANVWTGFGFRKIGKQLDWKSATGLAPEGSGVVVQADGAIRHIVAEELR